MMHLLSAAAVTVVLAAATSTTVPEIELTFSPPVRCNATQRTGAPYSGPCPPVAQPPSPPPPVPKAPIPSCEMTAVVGCFQWPRLDYSAGFYPTFKGNNSHFTQGIIML